MKIIGGARLGFVNYTWPLATLTATTDELALRTSFFGLFETGKYVFTREQVVSINEYGVIPFLGRGIQINHTVSDYPQKIVFWCNPASLLSNLSTTGFIPSGISQPSETVGTGKGVPFRWGPFLALIVIWNVLIGCDVYFNQAAEPQPGLY